VNLPTYVGRIHIHQVPEDRGMWRQRSGVLQYICERSITVPYERKPVCKRRKLLANVLQPKLFTGRSAQHPSYGFRVRQHVQDVLDESRQVLRGRYDDIIFRSVNGNGPAVLLPRPALKLGRGAKSEEYAPCPRHSTLLPSRKQTLIVSFCMPTLDQDCRSHRRYELFGIE